MHLIEIDLLRSHPRMPFDDPVPPAHYLVMVCKAGERPKHPYDAHGADRVTFLNETAALHTNTLDFLGPFDIDRSGRTLPPVLGVGRDASLAGADATAGAGLPAGRLSRGTAARVLGGASARVSPLLLAPPFAEPPLG